MRPGLKPVWTVECLRGADRGREKVRQTEREKWRDGEMIKRSVVTISPPHLHQQFLNQGSFRKATTKPFKRSAGQCPVA